MHPRKPFTWQASKASQFPTFNVSLEVQKTSNYRQIQSLTKKYKKIKQGKSLSSQKISGNSKNIHALLFFISTKSSLIILLFQNSWMLIWFFNLITVVWKTKCCTQFICLLFLSPPLHFFLHLLLLLGKILITVLLSHFLFIVVVWVWCCFLF